MALIKCSGCGHIISDKASKCPKCGCAQAEKQQRPDVPQHESRQAESHPGYYNEEDKSYNKTGHEGQVKCSSCGHMLSGRATICPECGIPMGVEPPKEKDSNSKKGWGIYIVLTIILIIVLLLMGALFLTNHGKSSIETNTGVIDTTSVDTLSNAVESAENMEDNVPLDTVEIDTVFVETITNEVQAEKNNDIMPDKEEDVNQSIGDVQGTGAPIAEVGSPAPIVEEVDDDRILDIPEESAEFPGDVYDWLNKNINYPPECKEQNIQGRVSVQFVINKDGSVVDVKVLRSPDDRLSVEAERVVKAMPKWKPARNNNKPVRMRYVIPVMFRLS